MRQFALLFVFACLTFASYSQTHKSREKGFIDSLCKNWSIDSLQPNDMKIKFAPPDNIKSNFICFKNNMTFTAKEENISISGKWKVDIDKREVYNYDMDNPELKEGIVLHIVYLSNNKLAITSNAASGNQIVLYYLAK